MNGRVDQASQEHLQPGAVEVGPFRRSEQDAHDRDVVERRDERDDPIGIAYEWLRSHRFDQRQAPGVSRCAADGVAAEAKLAGERSPPASAANDEAAGD
jgi:hypothetical protein